MLKMIFDQNLFSKTLMKRGDVDAVKASVFEAEKKYKFKQLVFLSELNESEVKKNVNSNKNSNLHLEASSP